MVRTPTATYRLQFTPEFTFDRAREILDYLSGLGVSDVYASPVLVSRRGSEHGYDVVDPGNIDPELGGEEGFQRLMRELREHGLGWVQDIVPNHMAYAPGNPYLMDVLESGVHSRYRDFFDIDWEHPDESMRGKVLAPFLGRFYGEALEAGEIRLLREADGFFVAYYEHRFPLAMRSYASVLTPNFRRLKEQIGEEHPDYIKYLGVLYVLRTLAPEPGSEERYGQIAFVKRVLSELYEGNETVREFIDGNVAFFNGTPGEPGSFDALDALLSEQHFRLSFWKVAGEEINYRRFFNINELISLNVQRPEVFADTHAKVLGLCREHGFTGLRVDHVDGLYDPTGYLRRLAGEVPGAAVWVEKILEGEEPLPAYWATAGATGYEFLNHLGGLFCRGKNGASFRRIYREFSGLTTDYEDLVSDKKRLIIGREMAGDVNNLAMHIKRGFGHFRYGRDLTLYGLRRAIVEALANFPVYRTYFDAEHERAEDREYLSSAMDRASARLPALAKEFQFLKELFLAGPEKFRDREEYATKLDLVMRFQQFTGPLMAKGFEDTLLYCYNRLLSLNEVGGSPDRFGLSRRGFHAFCRRRAEKWPAAMSATATHDTKRGEDARMRLMVLSELPGEWRAAIRRWRRLNRGLKRKVAGRISPDANDEYFIYQTLLASWPLDGDTGAFRERLEPLAVKFMRESKRHSSWTMPDEAYERAYLDFLTGLLDREKSSEFLTDFSGLQGKTAFFGALNSLSQTLVRLAAPGVPDVFQGREIWDLSQVDPDNRAPVDYGRLRALLGELAGSDTSEMHSLCRELLASWPDGRVKLFTLMRGLAARKANPDIFARGDHLALAVEGTRREHVVAFARRLDRRWAICAAPRFMTDLVEQGGFPLGEEVWGDTWIRFPKNGPREWTDAVTGEILAGHGGLSVAEAMRHYPGSLLLGGRP